jgi:hypothetical protein
MCLSVARLQNVVNDDLMIRSFSGRSSRMAAFCCGTFWDRCVSQGTCVGVSWG